MSKYISKNWDELYPFDDQSKKDGLVLSKELIEGLHGCIEAGMTSAQITAVLLLTSGLYRMNRCDPMDLMGRIHRILNVIEHEHRDDEDDDEYFLEPEEEDYGT